MLEGTQLILNLQLAAAGAVAVAVLDDNNGNSCTTAAVVLFCLHKVSILMLLGVFDHVGCLRAFTRLRER